MDEGRRRQQQQYQRGVQTYDLGVGFFGFFAVAFFFVSLFFQISGNDPIWASLSAIASFAVVGVIWLFRRRFILRSKAAPDA